MKKAAVCLLVLLAAMLTAAAGGEVIINELLASNGLYENGRNDDWVELMNTGDETVDISGWHLSNSFKNMEKYTFPDGTKLKPGNGLVVYCDSDNDKTNRVRGAQYASFGLSKNGGFLYLTDKNGDEVQTLEFPAQYANVSYGVPDGGSEYRYFESPTKGAKNTGKNYTGRSAEPVIVTAAGRYASSVKVEITCEKGDTIYYTTDCSTPDRSSERYTGPFTVSKTTVVRAIAVREGNVCSSVAGSTFIIEKEASPVPVVSIYTDYEYFYGTDHGMLVEGRGKTPNYKKDLESPAQVEYFDENGVRQISQMITCTVAGHSSRSLTQKSLCIHARSAYGPSVFAYPFFEDRPYEEYSCLVLRNTSSDYLSCRMRDVVFSEMSRGLDLYYCAGRPILVYINGKFYGHYNLREKCNKDSLAQWEGIIDEDLIDGMDLLEGGGWDAEHTKHGSFEDWAELCVFCKDNDLNDPDNLKYVTDRLDVDSMFTFIAFTSLSGSTDYGNARMYRFPGGKWKFLIHDIEASARNLDDTPIDVYLADINKQQAFFAQQPFVALMQVPEYREKYLRTLAWVTENSFLYWDYVEPIYQKWISVLEEILPRHIQSFPALSLKTWRSNVKAVMYYTRRRPEVVIERYCDYLNVTDAEKEAIFADILQKLAVSNAADKPMN